ncbi:MAG: TetR/AcrR family transcriptional regulator [Lachnospiraceae bacterium]|nr:TetR/AcrR family transcriptional regulator [Lachnospiraceae bacterium]
MPPKVRVSKDKIIEKAVGIVQNKGLEGLNARSLAKELNCSVQPVFRAFSSMEELKEAVFRKIAEYYQNYLRESISLEDGLVGLEMAYIRFAREEKHFFRLLYMSERQGIKEMGEFTSVGINKEIIDAMAAMTGLTQEKATKLYLGVLYTAHGIASMLATNSYDFQDEEIREIMENVFDGLCMKLKKD